MKQILAVLGFLWAIQISAAGAADQPRSIIYFIGDGMGMEYLAAYRHFADDPATPQVETSWFDRHLVGAPPALTLWTRMR